ncbi:hypothetical protein CDAR_20541 [Caerostris darwini]|uniref:Uncharacterized protein n=1 Tax=Caerostris darwini TaxID=1538125 RepID=A0AAV4QGR2_9ARAC|nr:hypothetical protein CDAR_20541 [Caerostris darwini]
MNQSVKITAKKGDKFPIASTFPYLRNEKNRGYKLLRQCLRSANLGSKSFYCAHLSTPYRRDFKCNDVSSDHSLVNFLMTHFCAIFTLNICGPRRELLDVITRGGAGFYYNADACCLTDFPASDFTWWFTGSSSAICLS